MRIVISSADPVLSRMLYLEAKRLSLDSAAPDATLFLCDLDHPDPAVTPETGAVCIGFSSHPDDTSSRNCAALLPLPLSARAFDRTVEVLFPRHASCLLILDAQSLLLGGKPIHLSPAEAALFSLLYEHRDRVISEAEIATVLGDSAKKANTPAVYLYRLRRKLCADGKERIRTVRGKGAQWVGEVAPTL